MLHFHVGCKKKDLNKMLSYLFKQVTNFTLVNLLKYDCGNRGSCLVDQVGQDLNKSCNL